MSSATSTSGPSGCGNALNAIAERMDQNRGAAQRMTADLADLIRDALQDLGDEGTIGREMERLTTYLAVEKSRFEDQLQLTLTVSPAVLTEPCPPLLLLPLLENAVRHGSRSTAEPLWVRLQIEPGGAGEVRISVSNPGATTAGRCTSAPTSCPSAGAASPPSARRSG